jgi:hypothetical protein
MQTPGTLSTGKPMTYGLGLVMRDYRGLASVSHGGSWVGYRAELLRFPEQNLAVACLCNLGGTDPSELARKVAGVYLGSQMTSEDTPSPAAFVTLSESELQSRAGTFWDQVAGEYLFLSPKEGKLLLESGGSSALFLPLSSTRFVAESSPSVELLFEGEALTFKRRDDTQRFSRIEPWKPTPSQLEELRGRYRSDEIAGAIEVEVESGSLVLRHRTIPRKPLVPTRSDSFYIDGIRLSFTRDGAGKVDGFALDMGRVKGIVYSKER